MRALREECFRIVYSKIIFYATNPNYPYAAAKYPSGDPLAMRVTWNDHKFHTRAHVVWR